MKAGTLEAINITVRKIKQRKHTSNSKRTSSILSTDQKDNILLGGIDVLVLQKEDLVDSIILQDRELDKYANGTCEGLFNDQILLSPDLETVRGVSRVGFRCVKPYIRLRADLKDLCVPSL